MNHHRWRGSALVSLLAFALCVAAAETPPATNAPAGDGKPDANVPSEAKKTEVPVQTASPASVLIPDSLKDITFESWTDWFHPGRWGGGIGLSVTGQRERIDSPGSSQTITSRITDEVLTLRNEEFAIIDPRLVSGTIGLLFGLEQFRQTVDDVKVSEHQKLIGYNVDLSFLSESPYRSSLYANRSQVTTALISGGTSKTETQNSGLILRVGENSILRTREILPYFSASLDISQEHTKETTRVGDQVFRLDDERQSATLDVHNGTETSDLSFKYSANDIEDRLSDANSYRYQNANLLYSLDFGPTLNWRWDSALDYYKRNSSEALSASNTAVSETLTIDHYDNLSSAYDYQYARQTSIEGTVTSQSAGAQVQHRLYANLTTSAGASVFKTTLPDGSTDAWSTNLNFGYDHAIPLGGHLTAGLGGTYAITNSHTPGGSVPVVDAPYTAPPSFGAGVGFQLKDSFIVASTISIVDVKGGSRIPTVVGTDYIVVVDGYRTSIEPLPTSVIIMPNDRLEVSYIYEVPPDLKYRITSKFANLGLFWQWISLDLSHAESDSTPLTSGDASLLVSYRQDSARLALTGEWDSIRARGDASVVRNRGNQLDYETVTLDEFLDWGVTPGLFLSFSANQFRTNYTVPVRRVSGNSVRLDANMTWNEWVGNAYAMQRHYSDTEIGSEKYQEAGFKLNRRWLKLDLTLLLAANRRWRSGVETQNATVLFTAVRRF